MTRAANWKDAARRAVGFRARGVGSRNRRPRVLGALLGVGLALGVAGPVIAAEPVPAQPNIYAAPGCVYVNRFDGSASDDGTLTPGEFNERSSDGRIHNYDEWSIYYCQRITLQKANLRDEPLGATFQISHLDSTGAATVVFADVTPVAGVATLYLPAGEYLLEEYLSQPGYLLPEAGWKFEIDANGEVSTTEPAGLISLDYSTGTVVIKVVNLRIGELPLTGAGGRRLFAAIGFGGLIAIAIYAARTKETKLEEAVS